MDLCFFINDIMKPTPFSSLFLPVQFKCCGSNSSHDWTMSVYILSKPAEGRVVPDSCCKTITPHCGKRDHPSNIYKVEVRWMTAAIWSLTQCKCHRAFKEFTISRQKCSATMRRYQRSNSSNSDRNREKTLKLFSDEINSLEINKRWGFKCLSVLLKWSFSIFLSQTLKFILLSLTLSCLHHVLRRKQEDIPLNIIGRDMDDEYIYLVHFYTTHFFCIMLYIYVLLCNETFRENSYRG